ncbi:ABATE domain-containing protein [Kosakonia sp. BYX6]|uniref:ABATE domain-containing protein n=1 Tax=Kosakonia calanthes TaxID=3139408 RepID=A0ABZ3BD76_9ENTR
MATTASTNPDGPWFIAEHSALDFINTLARAEKGQHDFLQSDEDVMQWLRHLGLQVNVPGKPGELLASARKLREIIREVVEEKKQGKAVSLVKLNAWLVQAQSHLQLTQDDDGVVKIQRIFQVDTPQRALAPVAEMAAELIAQGQFEYIRQCEHPDCTLWFYDKTKAHRRRWCSMALCGNRAKVARFRAKS